MVGNKEKVEMKKHHISFLCIAVLILLLLACAASGGYSETGSMTTSSHVNRKGSLTKTIRKANGSTTKDLGLDDVFSPGDEVYIDATLGVSAGYFKMEFLDGDEVVLELYATFGEPDQGTAVVRVDALGEIRYRVTAENAEKVEIAVKFEPH